MRKVWLLTLIAAISFGCGKNSAPEAKEEHGHHEEAGHSEGHVEISEDAQKIADIQVVSIGYQNIQDALRVPGTVRSTTNSRAVVTPPVAGRVVSLSVQLGDTVRQGQALAILESPELAQSWSTIAEAQRIRDAVSSELKQAKAEVELSLAKVIAARANLARQQELVKAGAFSQAPVQQAQSELNDAQSDLLSIQKEQTSHTDQLRRLENLFREGIVSKSELEASRLELQQDQIKLDRIKARIDIAKLTYEREKNIASRGLLNAKELQTAASDVRSSKLELDRSRLKVKGAESALASANRSIANASAVYRSNSGSGQSSVGRVTLVAPITGTITHLNVNRGQAVDRTQVLLEVENLQAIWVTANVPEKDSAKVRKGAEVIVVTAAFPGREFRGIVQVVGSQVDPKTRSIATQCLVSEAAGMLKPDMFATVHLGIGKSVRRLVVPKSAIVTEDRKSFVFVKEEDKFEKREVTLGTQSGDVVAIESGLSVGDKVASKGAFVLSSEQKKDELKGHED